LQCVAVCCSVLQYVVVCCSVLQCATGCLSHQQPSGELIFVTFGFCQRAAANSTVNTILSHPSTSAAPPHTPTATSSPAGLGAGTSSVTPKGGEGGEGGLGVSRTFVATSEEWSVCVFNDCVGFNVPLAQVVVSLRMYTYVCMYVYICMYIHMYVVYVYICMYVYSMHMYIYVCINTYICIHMYVYIHWHKLWWVWWVCVCIYMYVYTHVCGICIHMSMHMCVVHAYICMYSYMYAWWQKSVCLHRLRWL